MSRKDGAVHGQGRTSPGFRRRSWGGWTRLGQGTTPGCPGLGARRGTHIRFRNRRSVALPGAPEAAEAGVGLHVGAEGHHDLPRAGGHARAARRVPELERAPDGPQRAVVRPDPGGRLHRRPAADDPGQHDPVRGPAVRGSAPEGGPCRALAEPHRLRAGEAQGLPGPDVGRPAAVHDDPGARDGDRQRGPARQRLPALLRRSRDPGPRGLVGHRLSEDSGLAGEEVYFEAGSTQPFTIHCLADDGSGYPAPCLTELHAGEHLSIQIRFRKGLLEDWAAIKKSSRALLASFGVLS